MKKVPLGLSLGARLGVDHGEQRREPTPELSLVGITRWQGGGGQSVR